MDLRVLYSMVLSDKQVTKKYIKAGNSFGDALSYSFIGNIVGFDEMLERWAIWESIYANRGFRTIPIEDFIMCGGYGDPHKSLMVKRLKDEPIILHASYTSFNHT